MAVLLVIVAIPFGATTSAHASTIRPTTWGFSPTAKGWQIQNEYYSVSALACPTTLVCMAVGETMGYAASILTSANSGQTWNTESLAGFVSLHGISCFSASNCVAVGTALSSASGYTWADVVTTDGGATWTPHTIASGEFQTGGLSCVASTSVCYAAASIDNEPEVFVSQDGGHTWTSVAIPVAASNVVGAVPIACPTTTTCLILGNGWMLQTEDSGSSWTLLTAPSVSGADVLVCPAALTCLLGGADGAVAVTQNFATTWQVATTTSTTYPVQGISCWNPASCVAALDGPKPLVATTTDTGSSWSTPKVSGSGGISTVSCPSATLCVAAGENGLQGSELRSSNAGVTWKKGTLPIQFDANSVSCVSTSTCVATTAGSPRVVRSTNGGETWSSVTGAPAGDFVSISCSVPTLCVTVANDGATSYSTDAGATWSTPEKAVSSSSLVAVSCAPNTQFCVAVGRSKKPPLLVVSTNGGASWTEEATPAGLDAFTGVSCASASACVASGSASAGGEKIIYTTNGATSWQTGSIATAATTTPLEAVVSCPTVEACFAATGQGELASTDGGATWTTSGVGGVGASGYAAISCPTALYCLAAFAGSEVVATTDGGLHWFAETTPWPDDSGSTIPLVVTCATDADCWLANVWLWATTNGGLPAPVVTGVSPSLGPTDGGSRVTISGTYFAPDVSVEFGSTSATAVQYVNADELLATVPSAGAGVVDITVTTPGGTSLVTPNDQYTYLPAPVVTGINPDTGPTTGGTEVMIFGQSFADATSVDFGGMAADSFSVSSPDLIIAYAPPESVGTVDVTVTTPGGTSDVTPEDQYTYTSAP